ncbi:MAG: hypothetical protein ABI164_07025 [Acidobacteriaceae bacterium]
MNFSPFSALLLFPAMVIFMELGRRLRIRRKVEGQNSAIEGAVFALFGLLLAFTFSGAMNRYDAHRILIVQETNNIDTAYLRLDLLPSASQPKLRRLFRDYTNSRLYLYGTVAPEIAPESARLQQEIWSSAVAASQTAGASPDAAKLLLPAINDMINITSARKNAFNMHPPWIVYLLLFVLSCCCAFMAGYGMASRNWLYILAFAFVVMFTVYATLQIEYPRRGLTRFIHGDRKLISLRDSMR